MLKKIALAASLAVLAVSSQSASADQLEDIMAAKVIRCGTFADVPPFAAPDPPARSARNVRTEFAPARSGRRGR